MSEVFTVWCCEFDGENEVDLKTFKTLEKAKEWGMKEFLEDQEMTKEEDEEFGDWEWTGTRWEVQGHNIYYIETVEVE